MTYPSLIFKMLHVEHPKICIILHVTFLCTAFALPPRIVGRNGFAKEHRTARQMLRAVRQIGKSSTKSKAPEAPVSGPGQGGRLGAAGGTLHSYVARQLGLQKKQFDDDEDPREAILKHAEEAERNPYWVAPAYKRSVVKY